MKTLCFALLLGTLAACGGGSAQKPDPTAPKTGVQLALAEMKLIDVNKNQAVLIHADGTIELEGKKPAKVTADGKLVKIDTGEVGMTLGADGTITKADGKPLDAKITAEGAVTMGDKTISIDSNGDLLGGNPDGPKMKIEGATDANLKRTAMFVLLALIAPGDVKEAQQAPAPPAP